MNQQQATMPGWAFAVLILLALTIFFVAVRTALAEPEDGSMAPDNSGKGSGPWQCYACLGRVEALTEGFNTRCPFCGSYELHLETAGR